MVAKAKSSDWSGNEAACEQFVFVEVPEPSNDNHDVMSFNHDDMSLHDISSVSPDVLFVVGEYIFDFDETDPAGALIVALDGAADEAAEYEAFSSSVMFVFGDVAAEA